MAKVVEPGSLRATLTVAMSSFLEAGSIVAGAAGLTLWVQYLGLTEAWVGLLGAISANGFGAAVGALISGILVDRFGRKFIYKYNLLVYMAGVLLITVSVNFPMLLIGYLVTGVSVGASIPPSWTYIAEEAPDNERAARVGWGQFAWSLGPAVIFSLAVVLAPLGLLGSRIIFGTLFVVAFFTWLLQRQISESSIWQGQQKDKEKVEKQPFFDKEAIKELFTNRANREAMILLIGIYTFWNLVAGTMGYFMPYIYETVGGLTGAQANMLQAALWTLTALSAYFVFIKMADKVNQRNLFAVGAVLGIVAWLFLTFGTMGVVELIVFVTLWGVAAGFGAQAFYGLWAAELFHTRYRGAAQGFLFFTARVGVGLISLVVPIMLAVLGFRFAGTLMIGLLIVHLVIGVWLAPNNNGKSLEQIQKERYGEDSKMNLDNIKS